MKTQKMSLANIQGRLSRAEMKKIMAGSGGDPGASCNVYCGTGTGYTCAGTCSRCVDAGNGSGTKPGQDKLCAT